MLNHLEKIKTHFYYFMQDIYDGCFRQVDAKKEVEVH